MHKRETFKIVLITIGVLAVIVINAIIFNEETQDILDVPETIKAKKPVPDFSVYTQVEDKKAAFFNYLRPEVEKQNAYLLTLRHYVQTLYRKALAEEPFSEDDITRLAWLEKEYRVKSSDPLNTKLLNLLQKIDVLPAELVLVQAANESAWGTSRFAREGYNFFGMWCFVEDCGFVPKRRNEGAVHEVAKYDDLSQAMYSYMRNLNRHPAYKDLRDIRAQLRNSGKEVTANALVEGLTRYSERGEEYIHELQQMIRVNRDLIRQ